jgi:hypothetical protein
VVDGIQWKMWKMTEEKRALMKRKYSKGACGT